MIEIDIHGYRNLSFDHLVLDFNGTIAFDGNLIEGAADCIIKLAEKLSIHVLTADTFGHAASRLHGLPVTISTLFKENEAEAKSQYVESLGFEQCVCIGNGRNDHLMLKRAALGIAVIQQECAAAITLQSADIVAPDIVSAMSLLLHPMRLIATLRS